LRYEEWKMVDAIAAADIDLYGDQSLLDPYPNYKVIRDMGPLVYLENLGMYATGRYAVAKEILARPDVFISGNGVMMNDTVNDTFKGGIGLCTDGNEHKRIRRVEARPPNPRALSELREEITSEADALVQRLVARGTFDAATELAQHLPLVIVSKLVGLPEAGRERMLEWAAANFDSFGPLNRRTTAALATFEQMLNFAMTECVRGKLKSGSWAEMLHDAADNGEISDNEARLMALSYVGPALDTTIFAISSAVWLFADNPQQWQSMREEPSLIPNAINEILRMESPIQGFSRYAIREHEFDGATLPADARVIVLFGSANRDERHWTNPEAFDIRREGVARHLSFGYGEHACIGMNLARMEMAALLSALAKRVERFECLSSRRAINNTLRGFQHLVVRVH
jgi:cytochrome P450